MTILGAVFGAAVGAQDAPRPPEAAPAAAPQAGPERGAIPEETEGPTPGAPLVDLGGAVEMALKSNFGLLAGADNVAAARYREAASKAQFYPKLTPTYLRGNQDEDTLGLYASQRRPWF